MRNRGRSLVMRRRGLSNNAAPPGSVPAGYAAAYQSSGGLGAGVLALWTTPARGSWDRVTVTRTGVTLYDSGSEPSAGGSLGYFDAAPAAGTYAYTVTYYYPDSTQGAASASVTVPGVAPSPAALTSLNGAFALTSFDGTKSLTAVS